MDAESLEFLRAVIDAPSPSGLEQPVRRIIAEWIKPFCDEVRHDVMGNVIGVLNPGAKTRVMLAGHCDEVGMMITNITDKGYIYFASIGGLDTTILIGQRVWIHGAGRDVQGVIGRKPIHLLRREKEEAEKVPKLEDLWIDIGAGDKKDAEKVVAVGDYVTIDADLRKLRNNIVVGRGFDARVGAVAVAQTVRLLSKGKKKPQVAVYAVATTQEELGMRGAKVSAYGINPHAGIAVEVGFASDYPSINKNLVGDIALGRGPIIAKGPNINPVLGQLLVRPAKARKIPYQIEGEPGATGTDANVIQMTQAGVATALGSVPNRYMHSPVELVSLSDLDNTSKLLAATVQAMKPSEDFTPSL